MNIRSFPSRHTRLRFALASVLVRFAVRVCPLNFADRFAEETEEACQELVESDPFYMELGKAWDIVGWTYEGEAYCPDHRPEVCCSPDAPQPVFASDEQDFACRTCEKALD
jgi:hypothetical protein